jgi:hypothetical protein
MRLRDFFITPPADSSDPSDSGEARAPSRPFATSEAGAAVPAPASDATSHARARPWRRRRPGAAPVARAVGVLAHAADAPVVGAAVGLVLGRGAAATVVCVHAPGQAVLAATARAPARPRAARLAASLQARDLSAEARGRLVLVALPDDPATAAAAAARALAACGELPSVFATAARHGDLDALLRARQGILVALPATADATLADLALAGAAALAPSAGVPLAIGPLQRALALAGLRAPRAIRDGVGEILT